MGTSQPFTQIVMDSNTSTNDYARGYQVYVSNDGSSWGSPIASGSGSSPVITVSGLSATGRYIRVVQTGSDPTWWWSIHEFNVYHN
jgi:hypothetical protein